MTSYVCALVANGVLEGDAHLLGHVFWASLHGCVVLKLAGKLGAEYDFDRISGEAFRVLFEGYQPKNKAV